MCAGLRAAPRKRAAPEGRARRIARAPNRARACIFVENSKSRSPFVRHTAFEPPKKPDDESASSIGKYMKNWQKNSAEMYRAIVDWRQLLCSTSRMYTEPCVQRMWG